MPRHRGTFDPNNPEPYELSRSRIEAFINCPACFWMDRVKGIKFPGMPGFLLNTATDTLLKKDFDKYRVLKKPHPLMESYGLGHLVPFAHEDFETWTKSLQLGLRTYFKEENLLIGGGLDDVWHDRFTDEIFIVDYKSTAGRRNVDKTALEPISLNGAYKGSYKRDCRNLPLVGWWLVGWAKTVEKRRREREERGGRKMGRRCGLSAGLAG